MFRFIDRRRSMAGSRGAGLASAVVAAIVLVNAPSALAGGPTGDFAPFTKCPQFTTGVNFCVYSQITGGEMTLDKLTVPIVNPVTLQFGLMINTETGGETTVGALDGETLSPTPQPVPGGLSSLIACNEIKGRGPLEGIRRRACRAVFGNPGFSRVTATTELAGPASGIVLNRSNQLSQEGVGLSLPVRIHLENPLLGKDCYIGSSAEPIVFNLTSGTTSPPPPNKQITGSIGAITIKDEFKFAGFGEHSEVDNAFSAPAATGCGGHFSSIVDPLIDSKIGLPSPAGYNTIIHVGYALLAVVGAVIESEK